MKALLQGIVRRLRRAETARRAELDDPWSLDRKLFAWGPCDHYTLRAACENLLCLGANGSGKTSAVGREVAMAKLRAGFGLLVLCVKSDEPEWWIAMAKEAGREDDVIVFGHPDDSPWRLNILDYESSRPGRGAGLTENIVGLIGSINEVADRRHGSAGGGQNEKFWKVNDQMLLRNAVDLCLLAGKRVTVDTLRQIVLSAPTSPEQARSTEWRERSPCWHCLTQADKVATTPQQRHDLGVVADYWLKVFPETNEKTRSIFVTSFIGTTDLLSRGLLRTLFSTDTNITPEAVQEGKIILVALPLKDFGDVGLIAATLWKQSFMRSIERRNVKASPRPACLWMDEAAHLVTSGDMLFASSCRSSRTSLVLMGHNLGSFHVAFGGGESGKAETDGLFSLCNSKIFCANSDSVTNEWAATLIGKAPKMFMSAGQSYQPHDWLSSVTGFGNAPASNAGMSEQMDYIVPPTHFQTLRTGGPGINDRHVDTIVVQSGRLFAESGTTWLPVTFRQKA